ncbi:MAG TPA: chorismate-binding protein, partial [Nocardioides sp.]
RLRRQSPHAHVLAVPHVDTAGRPATVVGASPELLVARTGAAVRSTPLAGSVPRAADPREDARRRAALVASAKDADEHRVVVDAVAAALAPVCAELVVPERPEVVGTDTMWHLATPVRGRLTDPPDPRCSVLHLAQALHPTPAVCGEPRAAAYALVEALEPRERGALTGVVGWVDGRGDGVAALVIRSAVVGSDGVRLYAGAGIVAGSDPEAEVRETAAKLRTMARALGVPDEVVR